MKVSLDNSSVLASHVYTHDLTPVYYYYLQATRLHDIKRNATSALNRIRLFSSQLCSLHDPSHVLAFVRASAMARGRTLYYT